MEDWLAAQARSRPDWPVLILPEGETISFRQLNHIVAVTAARLVTQTVESGEVVGLLLNDQYQFAVHALALMRLGCVLLPLNTRLTVGEITTQLANTNCHNLLTQASMSVPDSGTLQHIDVDELARRDASRNPDDFLTADFDLGRTFAIIHTSGTSGQPKGAELTYGNVFYSAMGSAYRIGVLPEDRWLCILPMYHVGGLSIILRSILYGTTVVLYPRFDVDAINQLLSEQPITVVSLVPTMLVQLLHARVTEWNPSLRLLLLGGAAATGNIMEQCLAQGIPVATTYGLTEASSQVTTALPEDVIRKPDSVGKPLLFTSVQIVDEDGQTVSPGTLGEVWVSGQTVFAGYHRDSAATERALSSGWLHTGDIGYLDDEGDLHIVDRRSDLIVTGGENVYPGEVEGVIRRHIAVKDVAVVGIDDAEWGQRVAAAVVLADGSLTTEADLIAYCREHLAGYKLPRVIRFVESLPQTASGKIRHAAVRELLQH